MKSFRQFITEAESGKRYHAHRSYDPEVQGRSQIRKQGEGGRVGAQRKKTEPEKRRTKAAGGGKTAPAKDYKPRKDIGTQRSRSEREQQPTQDKHTQQLTTKQQQRKAYLERKARERGEKTKTASQLLSKKTTKTDPNYKPRKTSGYTAAERKSITRRGERVLRDIVLKSTGKKSEKELKHPISSSGYKYRKKDK